MNSGYKFYNKLDVALNKASFDIYFRTLGETDPRKEKLLKSLRTIVRNRLTSKQREYVMKHYFEDKSVTQIAAEAGVNPATITRHLQRARTRIVKEMKFTEMII